jgi:hypothetical protein
MLAIFADCRRFFHRLLSRFLHNIAQSSAPGPIGVAVVGSCTWDVHHGYRNNGAGDGKFPDTAGER